VDVLDCLHEVRLDVKGNTIRTPIAVGMVVLYLHTTATFFFHFHSVRSTLTRKCEGTTIKGGRKIMQKIGPQELCYTLTEEEAFEYPPPRRTLCTNYEDCLEHAADQFWVSFTCRGCYLEELIRAGKLKELSPPVTTTTIYLEYPATAAQVRLD
jgi:hypothetical protein